MILSELRDYLRQRGQASLQDLARHFDAEPEALRGMLEHWIRKGQVCRQRAGGPCGSGCTQCDPATLEIYLWGTEEAPTQTIALLRDLRCGR